MAKSNNDIRKTFIQKRDSLSKAYIEEHSLIIKDKLTSLDVYDKANNILLYAAYKSEVLTLPIFEDAIKRGKDVYFPLVEGEKMHFIKVSEYVSLKEGYKGILEPEYNPLLLYEDSTCASVSDVIIVPGTCFSPSGARMGYGKGYYDRFLSNNKLIKIGICFDIQLTNDIIQKEHDVKMDIMING